MDLIGISNLKSLLEKHNLWIKKRLGQHFLINPHVLQKIVETANIQPNDEIIEIGPGPGVLTRELCAQAKKVTTVEKDHNIIPLLRETTSEFLNLKIIEQDALKFTPPAIKYKLVANLPYNIATPLLRNFLQLKNPPTLIVVLTQLEVAQKICARHGDMNVLALGVQIYGKPKIIAKISPQSFFPAPKVISAILQIEPYKKPLVPKHQQKNYFELIHKAFSQKRKRLSKTLKISVKTITELGLNENIRPQELKIEDWIGLIKNCR